MIVQFDNKDLESLYAGKINHRTRKIDLTLTKKFIKTVKLLSYIENIHKLTQHIGLNFEALKGSYKGKFSVRINNRYRLILRVEKDKILIDQVLMIEELTDHYKKLI